MENVLYVDDDITYDSIMEKELEHLLYLVKRLKVAVVQICVNDVKKNVVIFALLSVSIV